MQKTSIKILEVRLMNGSWIEICSPLADTVLFLARTAPFSENLRAESEVGKDASRRIALTRSIRQLEADTSSCCGSASRAFRASSAYTERCFLVHGIEFHDCRQSQLDRRTMYRSQASGQGICHRVSRTQHSFFQWLRLHDAL